MRKAEVSRKTAETAITVRLDLDGTGRFDNRDRRRLLRPHARPARAARADRPRGAGRRATCTSTTTTPSRTSASRSAGRWPQALGDKAGIRRYGACLLPMDEALVRAALDLSGRPFLVWHVEFPSAKIGTFDTELVREFFTAFAMNGGITLQRRRGSTASTATTSPRRRSRRWRGRCARRSSPTRARRRRALDQGHARRMTTRHRRLRERQPALGREELPAHGRRGRRRPGPGHRRPRRGGARRRASCCPASAPSPTAAPGSPRGPGLFEAIEARVIGEGAPFLGICVGAAADGDRRPRARRHAGLRLDPGRGGAARARRSALKIPHMGWNALEILRRAPGARGHRHRRPRLFRAFLSPCAGGPGAPASPGRSRRAGDGGGRARQPRRHPVPPGEEPGDRAAADRQLPALAALRAAGRPGAFWRLLHSPAGQAIRRRAEPP